MVIKCISFSGQEKYFEIQLPSGPVRLSFQLPPIKYYSLNAVEPRYFEVPREMEKKFKIVGFRNNQGSVNS